MGRTRKLDRGDNYSLAVHAPCRNNTKTLRTAFKGITLTVILNQSSSKRTRVDMSFSWKLTSILVLAAIVVGWMQIGQAVEKRRKSAHISFLATTAHVVVGYVPIQTPYIALPGYTAMRPGFSLDRGGDRQRAKARLEAFRVAANLPETAPSLDKLEVRVRPYGWNDFDTSFSAICGQLDAEWAKSVCDDPRAPVTQALPHNRFYLADDRALSAFDTHWTVGRERIGDHLRSMNIRSDAASVECDQEASGSGTLFCTAAIQVHGNLIAVWTVWNSKQETPLQMAVREGKAIQAFVDYGIGVDEKFDALIETVCGLRAPDTAGDLPNRNPACRM